MLETDKKIIKLLIDKVSAVADLISCHKRQFGHEPKALYVNVFPEEVHPQLRCSKEIGVINGVSVRKITREPKDMDLYRLYAMDETQEFCNAISIDLWELKGCIHVWKPYQGLIEAYQYCDCGAKNYDNS